MSRYLTSAVLLGFLSTTPAHARDYPLHLAFCEASSLCKRCIEEIKLNISVNMSKKSVILSGRSPTGVVEKESLTNCTIKSEANWQCEGFRGVVQANDGRLQYLPNKKILTADGKKYEVCQK